MDIKSVSNANNNVYLPKDLPQKGKDQKDGQEIKIQDKLEISDEAKNIQNSTSTQQSRLDQISARINSNFYNSDEVTNKVADKIYQEIKQTN